jgi:hypothetical protein
MNRRINLTPEQRDSAFAQMVKMFGANSPVGRERRRGEELARLLTEDPGLLARHREWVAALALHGKRVIGFRHLRETAGGES